jgi:hypothetical protein
MFRLILYVFAAVTLTFHVYGQRQVRVIKPPKSHPSHTNLGIGLGVTNSAVFLQRNTLDEDNIIGLTGCLTYDASKKLRVNVDYTRYQKVDIHPTWYNIRASTLEANANILWYSKGGFCFYPIAGISYNVFKGYFTGLADFQNLTSRYSSNHEVVTRWIGINTGVGMEYPIKPFAIFGSFKLRTGFSDGKSQLNIVDVCFNGGVRYNLRAPSLYKLFKGTGHRYYLDSDK